MRENRGWHHCVNASGNPFILIGDIPNTPSGVGSLNIEISLSFDFKISTAYAITAQNTNADVAFRTRGLRENNQNNFIAQIVQ